MPQSPCADWRSPFTTTEQTDPALTSGFLPRGGILTEQNIWVIWHGWQATSSSKPNLNVLFFRLGTRQLA